MDLVPLIAEVRGQKDAHLHPGDGDGRQGGAGQEPARLEKDVVVGQQPLGGDQPDGAATLTSTPPEAHAFEIGLPLLERRLRTMEGELRSFGLDETAEWCVTTANHVGSGLLDHYSEQMAHGDGADAEAPLQLEVTK